MILLALWGINREMFISWFILHKYPGEASVCRFQLFLKNQRRETAKLNDQLEGKYSLTVMDGIEERGFAGFVAFRFCADPYG